MPSLSNIPCSYKYMWRSTGRHSAQTNMKMPFNARLSKNPWCSDLVEEATDIAHSCWSLCLRQSLHAPRTEGIDLGIYALPPIVSADRLRLTATLTVLLWELTTKTKDQSQPDCLMPRYGVVLTTANRCSSTQVEGNCWGASS